MAKKESALEEQGKWWEGLMERQRAESLLVDALVVQLKARLSLDWRKDH